MLRLSRMCLLSQNFCGYVRGCACSSSASTTWSPPEEGIGEHSSVRRRRLSLHSPSKGQEQLVNSIRLIGTIFFPLKICKVHDRLGTYTKLEVRSSSSSRGSFQILIKMWDIFAEISLKYLRPGDFIYVAGQLKNYMMDVSGKRQRFYEVVVNELNYVSPGDNRTVLSNARSELATFEAKNGCHAACQILNSGDFQDMGREQLRLWQIFFSNPSEWWDNRLQKKYPSAPDFKHKDTKECLWIRPTDPPWVKIQLQSIDCEIAKQRGMCFSECNTFTRWEF